MIKYHLSAFVLASWVHTGRTKYGREKEAKRGGKKEARETKFCSPFQVIQVNFKSISSVHHVHEVP